MVEETERFTMSGNTITDHQTGLEWLVGPDEPTDWLEAQEWVVRLQNDWRMPTLVELEELFNAGLAM